MTNMSVIKGVVILLALLIEAKSKVLFTACPVTSISLSGSNSNWTYPLVPKPARCSVGYRFDAKTTSCVPSERVACFPPLEPVERHERHRYSDSECTDQLEPSYLQNPQNCSEFFICLHRQVTAYGCPRGLKYNPRVEACDWPEFVDCPEDSGLVCPTPGPLNYTVHLPHPHNCSAFYSCSNGVPVLLHCPEGLHFNPTLEVCDWPEHAGCNHTTDPNCTVNPDPECPALRLLPHQTECGLFYQCAWSEPMLKECPDGLHFNPEIQVCDWPLNVNCTLCGDGGWTTESPFPA